MAVRQYRIKNWAKFQHYKDRNPPWVKLHVSILASEDWVMLDDASKLLMVVCMIVAAKHDGIVYDDAAYFRRVAYLNRTPNLNPLIDCGFLEPLADASKPEQMQADARPEKEAEERQSRAETDLRPRALRAEFDSKFWPGYPKKVAKEAAFKAYCKSRRANEAEIILAGLSRFAASRHGQDPQFTPHASTWLTGGQWGDELSGASGPALRLVSNETEEQELENLKKLGVI